MAYIVNIFKTSFSPLHTKVSDKKKNRTQKCSFLSKTEPKPTDQIITARDVDHKTKQFTGDDCTTHLHAVPQLLSTPASAVQLPDEVKHSL